MSWSKYFPYNRIRWTEGIDSVPIRPSEPDVSIIREIVASALSSEETTCEDDLSIEPLDNGANHKVYKVTQSSRSIAYIFRVAVPLDPHLKLESEMATLAFLKLFTTIPVPKPVAWCSSADNKLGYEWALLEMIPGVGLREVWRKISWEQKLAIIDELAVYSTELWSAPVTLPQIGSLYFRKFLSTCDRSKNGEVSSNASLEGHEPPIKGDTSSIRGLCSAVNHSEMVDTPSKFNPINYHPLNIFELGPCVDGSFFHGRRRYLSCNRGPYKSDQDWIRALIEVEHELLKTTKLLSDSREEVADGHTAEELDALFDELETEEKDFVDEYELRMKLCEEYMRLLPHVFPPHEDESVPPRFVLYHTDLRKSNIIVDPRTCKITGIIDWETAAFVPEWYGRDPPRFIDSEEPYDEEEPPVPDHYDSTAEDYQAISVLFRDLWDARLLRRRFDAKMGQLGWPVWRRDEPADVAKVHFVEGVSFLGTDSEASQSKLENVKELLGLH